MKNALETALAYWKSAALFAALRINLFEKLGQKYSSPEEISAMTQTSPDMIIRLLRALTAFGMLEQEGNNYRCTETAINSLVPGREGSVSNFCRVMSEDFRNGLWLRLPDTMNRGLEIPPVISDTPAALFTKAMNDLAHQGEAQAFKEALYLPEEGILLDLGCGSGAYAIAVCKKFPKWKGIVVDRPEALAVTRQIVDEFELDERIELKSGDFFNMDFKAEFDLVILSDVLYMEDDKNRRIISIAFNAVKRGGLTAIRGYFINEENPDQFPALFDLNMMIHDPKHRTPLLSELSRWLEEQGFIDLNMKRLTEMSWIVTASKPTETEK